MSGLPPHKLLLKIGAPVILLQNINPSEGLCNETRLICCAFAHVIEVQVITGKFSGSRAFLEFLLHRPMRILPFVLKRPYNLLLL